jgi:hypothetical protein
MEVLGIYIYVGVVLSKKIEISSDQSREISNV